MCKRVIPGHFFPPTWSGCEAIRNITWLVRLLSTVTNVHDYMFWPNTCVSQVVEENLLVSNSNNFTFTRIWLAKLSRMGPYFAPQVWYKNGIQKGSIVAINIQHVHVSHETMPLLFIRICREHAQLTNVTQRKLYSGGCTEVTQWVTSQKHKIGNEQAAWGTLKCGTKVWKQKYGNRTMEERKKPPISV